MPKLEVAVLIGAESKEWLAQLENIVSRLEKETKRASELIASKKDLGDNHFEAEHTNGEITEDDDNDFTEKKTTKKASKKASSFDDEDEGEADEAPEVSEEDEASFDSDDEDEDALPKKKKAQKKISLEDVNDACKARASQTGGKAGREEVLKILKKKFKTSSLTDLKPEQYPAVLAAMSI